MSSCELSAREKKASEAFKDFLDALGCFKDDREMALKTSARVAKMYNRELLTGLNNTAPDLVCEKVEENNTDIVIQRNIEVNSLCKHHFLPVLSKVTIAYMPKDYYIGLSKLNRIAQWCGQRPILQEELTKAIAKNLIEALEHKNVAVIINGVHLCVKMRGVKDADCTMKTMSLWGRFYDNHEDYQKLMGLLKYE